MIGNDFLYTFKNDYKKKFLRGEPLKLAQTQKGIVEGTGGIRCQEYILMSL